jgi:hypothetical protein
MNKILLDLLRHGLKTCCRIGVIFIAVFFVFSYSAKAQEKKSLAFKKTNY